MQKIITEPRETKDLRIKVQGKQIAKLKKNISSVYEEKSDLKILNASLLSRQKWLEAQLQNLHSQLTPFENYDTAYSLHVSEMPTRTPTKYPSSILMVIFTYLLDCNIPITQIGNTLRANARLSQLNLLNKVRQY